ncbi:MAG: hypothetical protein JST92_01895 [Deltaproteobacteria bacterium]|nr:hypothetical protein [Deltaproteobacteria bacterium]
MSLRQALNRSSASPGSGLRARAAAASCAFLVAAALGFACGKGDSTSIACNPVCQAGESCVEGVCQAGSSDAGADAGTDAGTDGGVSDACDPACPDWQVCAARVCKLQSGRCNNDNDCPATLPICDATHTCTAPVTATPAALTYGALIITNAQYAPQFQRLADLHTLTGVPTTLVTVESICAQTAGGCSATDACHDTAKAIKSYIAQQHAAGLSEVVLGGDSRIVPSRKTSDHYSNALYGVTYDETFYSDDYFADLTEWDTNGNCVYGEPGVDTPAYIPSVAISRVSVSTSNEADRYLAKATAYLTNYDTTRIGTALFMSNVATDLYFGGVDIPVDAAFYFEAPGRTLSLVPSSFKVTKLYSSIGGAPGASPLTVASERTAFDTGTNLVVHSGHGAEEDLTVEQDGSNEFTGDMAQTLSNTQFPIMLSCACEAATFDDGDGCAGQAFLTSLGGGVGYLGNSTIGLGIAGGMQLIDQAVKYTFSKHNPLAGEVMKAGHVNMPTSDSISIPKVPIPLSVIDAASWRWTQKAATYLGDGLLPIYTDPTLSIGPQLSARKTRKGNFSTVTFSFDPGKTGTLLTKLGSSFYEAAIDGSGAPVSFVVAGDPQFTLAGFSSQTTIASYATITLP